MRHAVVAPALAPALALALAIGVAAPAGAVESKASSVLERLMRVAPSVARVSAQLDLPDGRSMYLRALSYKAWTLANLNPDRLGPVGCGYNAMVDAALYASETPLVTGLVEAGADIAEMVAGATAPVCPISALVGGGDADVGAARLRQMNLPICQGTTPPTES